MRSSVSDEMTLLPLHKINTTIIAHFWRSDKPSRSANGNDHFVKYARYKGKLVLLLLMIVPLFICQAHSLALAFSALWNLIRWAGDFGLWIGGFRENDRAFV